MLLTAAEPRLVLLGVAVFAVAALAQAVTGFGSAMVAVPLLALAVSPVDAVIAATIVGLILTTGAWRRERAHVDLPRVGLLAGAGVLGMPFGLVLLAALSEEALTYLIAGTVLCLVLLIAVGVETPDTRTVRATAGLVSGALLTSTGMNGPPLVIALHNMPPRQFRGTLQAVFALQNAVAVMGFVLFGLVSPVAVVLALASLVGLPIGWRVGNVVFARIRSEHFRWVLLGGLTATALGAILGAL